MQAPLVLYKENALQKYMDQFESEYGSLNIFLYTNHSDTLLKLVAEGIAVTIAMDVSFLLNPLVQSGELICIELEIPCWEPFQIGWVCAKDKRLSEFFKVFIARLEKALSTG
jgi:DNA-binding transcriptional LysR family regulator